MPFCNLARKSCEIFGLAFAFVVLSSAGVTGSNPRELDTSGSESVLEEFRRHRLAGDYSLLFTFRHMPRRGEDVFYKGQLWGTWTGYGSRTLVSLASFNDPKVNGKKLLVENGPDPKLWIADETGMARAVAEDDAELYMPIFPDSVYTPFEFQMPFIYWERYVDESRRKSKGRQVRAYRMYPPENFDRGLSNLGSVRIYIDEKFKALIKAQILDLKGNPLKTFKILGIKKVQNQVIVRRIDLLDEKTRDKTRFSVFAAALNLSIPSSFFDPGRMGGALYAVSEDEFDYFK